ncbi:2-succinyl-6-hydroxy-2,4-cyclohexadiene-1-carboxylate synthase [Bacillus sp. M6-12]|uniref:alpha/beta fold hydrolase n=1 Tax=Bacillus sp. M6-12 TaxID=2054166 RepID=UPI000C793014|nr:alpha/beta hydrolase [Bacillus sp. M6-12]PLS19566.1 2-succinyl-6-hydroxy-2,4-cyclohexadiene-1-carboxylate synthase [Bacillus sp. M6-12]
MLNYTKFLSKEGAEWVVFLHGIGGGSSIWVRQIKAFKEHFNLLLIDLPGHGETDYGLGDLNEHSFPVVAEEVLKVLNHENIEKAHFVGISLGTIVIQSLNDIAPEKVKSMILGGAVEKFNLPAKMIIQVANVMKNFLPYMWLYKLCALILMPKEHHKEARLAFVKEAYKLGRKEFLHWYGMHTQIEKTIKRIKKKVSLTPKLYIMGSEDYMFLPFITVNKAKNEALHIIDKCGHVCNIEQYKEFNQRALDFLISMKKEKKFA